MIDESIDHCDLQAMNKYHCSYIEGYFLKPLMYSYSIAKTFCNFPMRQKSRLLCSLHLLKWVESEPTKIDRWIDQSSWFASDEGVSCVVHWRYILKPWDVWPLNFKNILSGKEFAVVQIDCIMQIKKMCQTSSCHESNRWVCIFLLCSIEIQIH